MPFLPLLFLIFCGCASADNNIYVRLNQAGFMPEDIKTAVIFSRLPFPENKYYILDKAGKIVFAQTFKDTLYIKSTIKDIRHSSILDFSLISKPGEYRLKLKGAEEQKFYIKENPYSAIVDSLILFFRVQRCGPTDPLLHEPCHLSDATRVEGFGINSLTDVTGGWHDAGDYIKFLSTACYTTYMLLFCYEFDNEKFSFDNDYNGVPDVLEEARVGLDWLLRCRIDNNLFVTQVQDLRDHQIGWRLPEKDSLQFDRPAFTGIGKNIIGIYTAALALGARIWSSRFYDYEFAGLLLSAAEGVYSQKDNVPDIDKVHSGFYQDTEYAGKLSLGAVELFITAQESKYLDDAQKYATIAGSDFWWSWGNINSLAHYRLTKAGIDFSGYIRENILAFKSRMDSSLFGESVDYTWGTTNSMLGAALQVILYKKINNDNSYDSLAAFQRDYVLGRNPWGISFISGIGNNYPKRLHSQIAYFRKGYLPGALSAGPAPLTIIEQYDIKRKQGKYDQFNKGDIRYYDDFADYITNEPTITTNATALFVYGFYAKKGM